MLYGNHKVSLVRFTGTTVPKMFNLTAKLQKQALLNGFAIVHLLST